MARNRGSLLDCLDSIRHHLLPHNASMMVEVGDNTVQGIARRFEIVDAEAAAAIERIKKIKQILVQQGHSELAALFEEKFEYGTD